MKVIADKISISDADYENGSIIILSKREKDILNALISSCEEHNFVYPDDYSKGKKLDNVFLCIEAFTRAKFAINHFQSMLDSLNSMIGRAGDEK